MSELSSIRLFRMTHVENIPHILANGITHRSSSNANTSYKPIGDHTLISTRDEFVIPDGRKLGEFIPFYLGPRTPMLYVMQNGFNGVRKTNASEIVYCVSSVAKIVAAGNEFIFTNGHAIAVGLTEFYGQENVDAIDKLINFKDVYADFWKPEDDMDLKRRKEAEFLVLGDLPLNIIDGYIVYNQKTKTILMEYGIHERQVYVSEKYYF